MERWYKQGDELLREIAVSRLSEPAAAIWFMGQHGFVVKLGETVLYIDVMLNGFPDGEGKDIRTYPPPFPPEAPQRLDYYFCTHDHSDHLNLETLVPLAKANPGVTFIVPRPHRRVLIEGGIAEDRVIGADEGETLRLAGGGAAAGPGEDGGILVSPVASAHPVYEVDDGGGNLYLGYVIRGGGVSLYHSGDTYVTPRLVETLKKCSPIDVALLPVNGSDWERTAENIIGNIGALDAVKLVRALGIDLLIPSHYDLFPGNTENPGILAGYMYEHCPWKKYHILAPGECFWYIKQA
ncbi:MAG: MBL fold metallo-hydrolase [Treponema sp.]|nr:MBL fold metallo-hydrolase [Treponema sp.]